MLSILTPIRSSVCKYPLVLLIVSFAMQKIFSFISFHLFIFSHFSCLVFKARHSEGLSSQYLTSIIGILKWDLDLFLLGEDLCDCEIPSSWGVVDLGVWS